MSFVSKYFKVKDAVNVSPAPLTSIVSLGSGEGWTMSIYLAPFEPKVIITRFNKSLLKLCLLNSDSFN